jgi:hypothetical protein
MVSDNHLKYVLIHSIMENNLYFSSYIMKMIQSRVISPEHGRDEKYIQNVGWKA